MCGDSISLKFALFCDIHIVLEEFHNRICNTTSSPLHVASVLSQAPLCFLCVLVRNTEVL